MPERVLRPIFPSGVVELEIRKAINELLKVARVRASGRIVPAAKVDKAKLWANIDSLKWEGATAKEVESLRATLRRLVTQTEKQINGALSRENKRHAGKFMAQVKDAIGVDLEAVVGSKELEPFVRAAVEQNVALIKGLSDQVADRLETTLLQAITQGLTNDALEDILVRTFGFARSRAKLIARDQASKFNSSLNEIRQTKAGVNEYIWSTSKDERVRKTHRVKEGRRYKWSSPPKDTGHPGHDINCRCVAMAVLEF